MKKLLLITLCLCFLFIGFFSYNYIVYNNELENNIEFNIHQDCENFDGYKFLTSGGSKTPTTDKEIKEEIKRLNWICGGE